MRSARLLAVAVLAIVLALSSAQNVFAATLDQKQEESPYNYTIQILSSSPIGQEFKPSLSILEAVEVKIGTMNQGGDDTVTLTVRRWTITGTVIATASKDLVQGSEGWVYFSLTPVFVTPGSTYVIQLQATKNTFGWLASSSNPYPRGVAIDTEPGEGTHSEPEIDFCFRTYGSGSTSTPAGPVGGFIMPVNTFAVLAPWVAVIGLVGCIGTVVVVSRKRRS
jgi:hypothetical protein